MTDHRQRFMSRVDIEPGGCWHWTGRLLPTGYPEYRYYESGTRRYLRAHRVAYELFIGPIPKGLHLDHACHSRAVDLGTCAGGMTCLHRRCVNPTHLEAVSPTTNASRSVISRKISCSSGHPFNEANTGWIHRRNGRVERRCLVCLRNSSRRHRAELRAAST